MDYNGVSYPAVYPFQEESSMKRPTMKYILTFVLGLILGGGLLFLILTQGWLPNTRITITTGTGTSTVSTIVASGAAAYSAEPGQNMGNEALVSRALEVAGYIRDKDWASFAGSVHPDKGVVFTPYSSVSDSDLRFTPEEVAAFGSDSKTYLWGSYDGSGAPMNLTVADYFAQFVWNTDYTLAPLLAVDRVLSSGNAVENVSDAYPDARFVEFYYDGLDPVNEGFDWCALKLVFQPVDGQFMLVGVIHSEWTI